MEQSCAYSRAATDAKACLKVTVHSQVYNTGRHGVALLQALGWIAILILAR